MVSTTAVYQCWKCGGKRLSAYLDTCSTCGATRERPVLAVGESRHDAPDLATDQPTGAPSAPTAQPSSATGQTGYHTATCGTRPNGVVEQAVCAGCGKAFWRKAEAGTSRFCCRMCYYHRNSSPATPRKPDHAQPGAAPEMEKPIPAPTTAKPVVKTPTPAPTTTNSSLLQQALKEFRAEMARERTENAMVLTAIDVVLAGIQRAERRA